MPTVRPVLDWIPSPTQSRSLIELHYCSYSRWVGQPTGPAPVPVGRRPRRSLSARRSPSCVASQRGSPCPPACVPTAGSVRALRIVPAVPECPIEIRLAPVGSGPGVGSTCKSEGRTGRSYGLQSGAHPPARKARAAPMTSGPTSSISPSRSKRRGDRSSSCGFRP